jgi:hypothetical protein|tara:strand:- start:148 stop:921 length:774 start_codon:yes stop_codon:yes gene_type:complete
MKTAVVFTCAHADPSVSNDRFNWLGDLLYDIRPDYVVDLGDGADLKSLNSYDTRYPKAIVAQSYEADIQCYNDSQERIRRKFRQMKKKRPAFFGLEGNHENRIKKAIANDPRLEGSKFGLSFSHLNTDVWFDEYHEYNNSAPSIADYDGVSYAHYIASGNYGTALSGIHHAYGLIQKRHCSTTVGHSHKRSMFFKDDAHPNPTIGLVAGCFKGAQEGWAGQSNLEWWKGVIIKRNIQNGYYEPEFVSLGRLRDIYGK